MIAQFNVAIIFKRWKIPIFYYLFYHDRVRIKSTWNLNKIEPGLLIPSGMVNFAILMWNIPVNTGEYYMIGWNNLITVCSWTVNSSYNILLSSFLSLDNQFMKQIKLNQFFLEGKSLANCLWHHLLCKKKKENMVY